MQYINQIISFSIEHSVTLTDAPLHVKGKSFCPNGSLRMHVFMKADIPTTYYSSLWEVKITAGEKESDKTFWFNIVLKLVPVTMLIYYQEGSSYGLIELGEITHFKPGQSYEYSFVCGQNSIDIFINEHKIYSFTKLHEDLTDPVITQMEPRHRAPSILYVTEMYSSFCKHKFWFLHTYNFTFSLGPEHGIFDTLRFEHHESTSLPYQTPDEAYFNYGSGLTPLSASYLNSHFSIIVPVESTSDNSMFYHPAQAKQVCYKDTGFNIQCRILKVEHTDCSDAPNGFGGLSGIDAPTCKSSLMPMGKDCLSPTFNGPLIEFQAFEACSTGGDALLTPHDLVQNEVIKAMMIKHVYTGLN